MDVKRLKLMYKYCPHCQRQCHIKAYKDHKRLYFNSDTNTWVTVPDLEQQGSCIDSDSTIDLSSEDECTEDSLLFNFISNNVSESSQQSSDDIVTATKEVAAAPDMIKSGKKYTSSILYRQLSILNLLHVHNVIQV